MTIDQANTEQVFLIAGLGNPGREYKSTRHNIGFMVVDALAEKCAIAIKRVQQKAMVGTGKYQSNTLILVKPQTYMNLSGQSVGPLLRYYKVPLSHLLVIHDDLDTPFKTLRVRPQGGAGGQKGLASIIQVLGTKEFARLRMGIGRPPGRMDPANFVLENFTADQKLDLDEMIHRAVDAALHFVTEGIDAAMNKYNPAPEPPAKKTAPPVENADAAQH